MLKRKVPDSVENSTESNGNNVSFEKESKQFKTTLSFTPTNSLENSSTSQAEYRSPSWDKVMLADDFFTLASAKV